MLEETLSSEDTGMDLSNFFEHHFDKGDKGLDKEKSKDYYKNYNPLYFLNIFGYSPENIDYTFMIKKINDISNKHN